MREESGKPFVVSGQIAGLDLESVEALRLFIGMGGKVLMAGDRHEAFLQMEAPCREEDAQAFIEAMREALLERNIEGHYCHGWGDAEPVTELSPKCRREPPHSGGLFLHWLRDHLHPHAGDPSDTRKSA